MPLLLGKSLDDAEIPFEEKIIEHMKQQRAEEGNKICTHIM